MEQDEIFKEYVDRQKFEHELIDRRVTWLLTSQTILFAAYGLGASKENVISPLFLNAVAVSGILTSLLLFLGIVAGLRAKWQSWRDYLTLQNQSDEVDCSIASAPENLDDFRKEWGVRTKITKFAIIPDLFLPLIFLGAWACVLTYGLTSC
jgi:hypothetical protein